MQGSLNLFLQKELNESKAVASSNVAMFGGVCYLTPLIGGYIADGYLGRYRAILLFITFYLIGIIGVATIAWILSSQNDDHTPSESEEIMFWIALYLIALGTGGIKPNVSTLGAEQFETNEPQFSLKKYDDNDTELISVINTNEENKDHNNQQMEVVIHRERSNENVHSSLIINENMSNELHSNQHKQKESFFNWFYFSINLGSVFSFTVVAYLCQNVSFGIGYTVPCIALIIGIAIFILASKYYRIVPPQGSVLSKVVKILFYGLKSGTLNKAKIKYGNEEVESVKSIIKMIPFLAFFIMYWCVYAQLNTLFYAQGCQMDISITKEIDIPIASLGLFDVIPILILVPFFDRILIPFLRKRGFKVTMLQRMGCGFFFAMLSMVAAGVLEIYRKQSSVTTIESACNNSGDAIYTSDVSIFWQVPQFVLIGISEVLASVTGLEFFFSQSPPNMRSMIASLNLATAGLGSWCVGIFIALANSNKDNLWITDNLNSGHLDLYFFMIGGFCFVAFLAFVWTARNYVYNNYEKDTLVDDMNKPDVDAAFDEVISTSPKNSQEDVLMNTMGIESDIYKYENRHIKHDLID